MSDMSNVKPEPASEPNSAASVANAFLLRSEREQSPISPMKMQKLIYLAHGYFLAEQDKPMIAEKFEAWRFGPVLASIYRECKHFKGEEITEYLMDHAKNKTASLPDDDHVIETIDFVWKHYQKYDAMVLSRFTHEVDGPWQQTIEDSQFQVNPIVENDRTKQYFKMKLKLN